MPDPTTRRAAILADHLAARSPFAARNKALVRKEIEGALRQGTAPPRRPANRWYLNDLYVFFPGFYSPQDTDVVLDVDQWTPVETAQGPGDVPLWDALQRRAVDAATEDALKNERHAADVAHAEVSAGAEILGYLDHRCNGRRCGIGNWPVLEPEKPEDVDPDQASAKFRGQSKTPTLRGSGIGDMYLGDLYLLPGERRQLGPFAEVTTVPQADRLVDYLDAIPYRSLQNRNITDVTNAYDSYVSELTNISEMIVNLIPEAMNKRFEEASKGIVSVRDFDKWIEESHDSPFPLAPDRFFDDLTILTDLTPDEEEIAVDTYRDAYKEAYDNALRHWRNVVERRRR